MTTLHDLPGSTPIVDATSYSPLSPLPSEGASLLGLFEGEGFLAPIPDILTYASCYRTRTEITNNYEIQESDLGGRIDIAEVGVVVTLPSKMGEERQWVDLYMTHSTSIGLEDGAQITAEGIATDEGNAPILLLGDLVRCICLMPSMGMWACVRLGEDTYARKVIGDVDLSGGDYFLKQDDDRKTLFMEATGPVVVRLSDTIFDVRHSTNFVSHQDFDVTFAGDDYTILKPASRDAKLAENGSAAKLSRSANPINFDLIGDLAEAPAP